MNIFQSYSTLFVFKHSLFDKPKEQNKTIVMINIVGEIRFFISVHCVAVYVKYICIDQNLAFAFLVENYGLKQDGLKINFI